MSAKQKIRTPAEILDDIGPLLAELVRRASKSEEIAPEEQSHPAWCIGGKCDEGHLGYDTDVALSLVKPVEVNERILGVPAWTQPEMTVYLKHEPGAVAPIVIVQQGDRAADWHIVLTTDEAKDLGSALVRLWADGSYAGQWRKAIDEDEGSAGDRYDHAIRLLEILDHDLAVTLDAIVGERLAEAEDGRSES
jgi:hypothetical protein